MDPAEQLRKLYERLPAGSAFRRAIEQTLEVAEGITGIRLREKPANNTPPVSVEKSRVAESIVSK